MYFSKNLTKLTNFLIHIFQFNLCISFCIFLPIFDETIQSNIVEIVRVIRHNFYLGFVGLFIGGDYCMEDKFFTWKLGACHCLVDCLADATGGVEGVELVQYIFQEEGLGFYVLVFYGGKKLFLFLAYFGSLVG